MDFTREPIIETVITPKEGCKLVVRSSKSTGQEEYFVDSVEVVSFGHSFFFRSMERPKSFLVPSTDYEILEVREARMVLKNVGVDRTIKIGGGREAPVRTPRQQPVEKIVETQFVSSEEMSEEPEAAQASEDKSQDGRLDKKRDRRRQHRRRRGRDNGSSDDEGQEGDRTNRGEGAPQGSEGENSPLVQQVMTTSILTSLLPPPPTLISETIGRYKDNALFKDAFYSKDEPVAEQKVTLTPDVTLDQPTFEDFEVSEVQEGEIYQTRKNQNPETPYENESDHHHAEPQHLFEEHSEHDLNDVNPHSSQNSTDS